MPDETSPLLGPGKSPQNNGIFPQNGSHVDEGRRQESAEEAPPTKSQKSLLAIVIPMALGTFLVAMDSTIVVASYASIGSELNQLSKTSWIATGYLLTLTSFQPLYGKLSDIFGRKACLLVAYCIFGLGSLFCGLSKTMDQLILSRALAGVGGGGMSTVVSIIMSDIVPLRSRGTWQGIINIVFATGSSVGAPLGGFLADTIGWRWAFLIQCPAIVLALLSVSFALHLPPTDSSDFKTKIKRIDFVGAITLVCSVFLFLFGLERGGNVSWSDKATIGTLSGSAALFLFFGFVEMEWASEPFAPKRIILNRSLIASYFVNFFGVASALTMLFHVSLYFQALGPMSPSRAGLLLVPSVIGGVIGSLSGGIIIQATGKYYWVTVLGYCLLVVGSSTITLFSGLVVRSIMVMCVGLTISGFGNGGGITTSLIALISNAGQADQAIATAVSYLFRSLGSVVGLAVGSTILQDTLRVTLHRTLTGHDVNEIVRHVKESLNYLDELDSETKAIVLSAYERSIRMTMFFCLSMAFCAAFASFFIKETELRRRS
ncbi:hypothetical protein D9758_015711 [Tetrapyrgos nigripes]|uniref:Major facilitator superfamily (MFS) profile domain-containing protein n=1 Tax=Tetrapyrgos nigripes TaxID=182062 RepID=A0A8H5CC49_9AGAR|nr:hypothetical protein D9758_015711 [Tetrapyrgos nigripes]